MPIYQPTRQFTGLVSSSAPLQEPQIAHTRLFFFTDTNHAWFVSSHTLYVSLTDLRLSFQSILAIIVGPQKANSNCIQLQGLVIIYIYTHTHTTKSQRQYTPSLRECYRASPRYRAALQYNMSEIESELDRNLNSWIIFKSPPKKEKRLVRSKISPQINRNY